MGGLSHLIAHCCRKRLFCSSFQLFYLPFPAVLPNLLFTALGEIANGIFFYFFFFPWAKSESEWTTFFHLTNTTQLWQLPSSHHPFSSYAPSVFWFQLSLMNSSSIQREGQGRMGREWFFVLPFLLPNCFPITSTSLSQIFFFFLVKNIY